MQNKVYHRLEEFRELIWDDYISEFVISNQYIHENSDFLDEVLFSMHMYHQKTNGDFTLQVAARILESFLLNSFYYKPKQFDAGRIRKDEEDLY